MPLVERLEGWHPTTIAGLVAVGLAAVAILDLMTGPDIALSVFYVVPVSLATWSWGRRAGILTATLATTLWWVALRIEAVGPSLPISLWNAAVRLAFLGIAAVELAAIRELVARERSAGRRDSLTGALNPRGFYELLEDALGRLRTNRIPLTLAFLDLDDFKSVNDRRGHPAGDALLRLVVDLLRARLRSGDAIGRLGGDEFALLLPATDQRGAASLLADLHACLSLGMAERGFESTASLGWETFAVAPESIADALAIIDQRMYDAKAAGKGRVSGPQPP